MQAHSLWVFCVCECVQVWNKCGNPKFGFFLDEGFLNVDDNKSSMSTPACFSQGETTKKHIFLETTKQTQHGGQRSRLRIWRLWTGQEASWGVEPSTKTQPWVQEGRCSGIWPHEVVAKSQHVVWNACWFVGHQLDSASVYVAVVKHSCHQGWIADNRAIWWRFLWKLIADYWQKFIRPTKS